MEIPSHLFTGAGGPQVADLRERTPDIDIIEGDVSAHDDAGGGSADAASDVDEEYFSMDDDSEGSENEADEATRESERQRVFEAAGLIVDTSQSVMEAPEPTLKKRRAPPATPERVSIVSVTSTPKELPPVPTLDLTLTDTELDSSSHLKDAFDRYEAFKKTNGIFNNRMSISSFDTSPSSPPRSPAVSLTPSLNHRDVEKRTSQFLSFLGRHATRSTTPEPDRRSLVISGPILNTPSSGEPGPNREDGPSFGTVRATSFIVSEHRH
jgi:hypothetical protein